MELPKSIEETVPATARARDRKILAAFEECVALLPTTTSRPSREQFQALAQGLGIDSGDLDHMLRHSGALRRRVIGLLRQLRQILSEEQLPSGSQNLNRNINGPDIESALDYTTCSLVALLSTFKEPTPSDDIQRLSKAVSEDIYTQFDIQRMKDKFPKCHEKLQRRLGILNRLRRLRFQDAQFAFQRRAQIAMYRDFNARQNSSGPILLDETRRSLPELLDEYASEDMSETSSIASYTSGYSSVQWDADSAGSENETQAAEPRAIRPDVEPLQIPRMPKPIRDGTDTQCPFCKLSLEAGIDAEDWQNHVLQDLEPFMCTFGGCAQSYRTYGSRQDWQRHESSKHRLIHLWICHDCDDSWADLKEFKVHMNTKHQGTFMTPQLESIAQLCKVVRQNDRPRNACILCGARFHGTVQEEYDHLASHLLDIALFVLPVLDCQGELDSTLTDQEDDFRSDTYEAPESISGLKWLQHFDKNSIVPFETRGILGMGGFASTVSAVCTIGSTAGTRYAIKSYRKRGSESRRADTERRVMTEVEVLRRLRHVHVISIVGCYLVSKAYNLVLFPVADQNLEELLEESAPLQTKWFGCLAAGLAYLRAQRIEYLDAKPSNILIKGNRILFGGFGHIRDLSSAEDSESDTSPEYTPRYAAPEVLNYDRRASSSTIFSLGCVFLEMLTVLSGKRIKEIEGYGARPYGRNIFGAKGWLSHIELNIPSGLQEIRLLCLEMLEIHPISRPIIYELLDRIVEADKAQVQRPENLSTTRLIGRCEARSLVG
ncbi:hypothetical protein GP486_003587 [Trichoglossum hirsutum]|uniref:Protein kinase domain-containing protein n=1 Tax=Trichoglossum hirsutum TaxID=265104 RepID=A0A9P8LCL6_9PEZI|nr:hypothetical protein GP486_003587 [Trichoglossum hirsutum]